MASEEVAARPRSGSNGSRFILFIGLALGVVAAVLIALILSGGDDGETITVPATRVAVAATGDIPARTRLTRDMLEVKTYAVGDVDADAFTSVNQVLNRVTSADIAEGQVITPTAVSNTAGEGLTFSVGEGMRAVSIRVNEVVIAGGNISPDNRVDIIGTFNVIEGADITNFITQITGEVPEQQTLFATEAANLTLTVLQNVRILAVAQDLSPEAAAPTGEDEEEGAIIEQSRANPGAGTVTLEVTPQQAQAMAIADQFGTLRLSLRPFGEEEEADVTPIITVFN